MTRLFHREVFLPQVILDLGARTIQPRVTNHARRAALQDRYGEITIPESVTFSGADVIEAEMEDGRVVKLVIRAPYDAARDLVLAIGFEGGQSFLKTVWFNLKSDGHRTLDRSRYSYSL